MAINQVQMQPGLSMGEFIQQYGSEAQCEQALAAARWPTGFVCPACRCRRYTTFQRDGRGLWQCQRCRHQTTITAGTVFESTKLALTTWFLAMHLLTQAKNNVSALELKRQLGVSWRTAWRVKHKHKLMAVMAERESSRQLSAASRSTMPISVVNGPARRAGTRPTRFPLSWPYRRSTSASRIK